MENNTGVLLKQARAGSGGGASSEDTRGGFDLPVPQGHVIGVLESPRSRGRRQRPLFFNEVDVLQANSNTNT